MTEIYLIRHAEAEGNLYRRIHGQYDGLITTRGRRQIDALAERFKDVRIDAVYSSDLTRTKTTAEAILRTHPHLELNETPRLREVCMGVWEDIPWGEAAHTQPEQLEMFSNDPDQWRVDGCETFRELAGRMLSVTTELAQGHDGQTIAVFSHGMAIRSLLCEINGIPSQQIARVRYGDNTAVSKVIYEDGLLRVEYFNDNTHLPEEISTFAHQGWWKEKSGMDMDNLYFEPLDMKTERELYIDCYADSWRGVHGSLDGFDPRLYAQSAARHAGADPRTLMKMCGNGTFVGLVELDLRRHEEYGAGWITLCYLRPEYRNKFLGIQLIGHAVSVFRKLGRVSVRLHAAEENTRAQRFYQRYGFEQIGTDMGVLGKLLLMELPITPGR